MSILSTILQFVVGNGRVDQNEDGTFSAASMEAEVEFECRMRELDDATTAECIDFALAGKDVK